MKPSSKRPRLLRQETIGSCSLWYGDCRDALRRLKADGVLFDSVVCDPPYHLTNICRNDSDKNATPYNRRNTKIVGFMGKAWDGGDIAFQPDTWKLVFDVLKPGGYLLAMGGTRTYHRLVCAIEDAGFEIRDTLLYIFGTGFPKSLDISKAIDRAAGVERDVVGLSQNSRPAQNKGARGFDAGLGGKPLGGIYLTEPATDAAKQWAGWGNALKPAHELVICAQRLFNAVPCLATLVEMTIAIEALLWSVSPARLVDAVSVSSPADLNGEPRDSVRWLAAVSVLVMSGGWSDMMDTFSSPEMALTYLSIVLLWNATLAALCSEASTFTIKMETGLTTGLKTLTSWILAIMPESIIRVATTQNGLWSPACSAESGSSALNTSFGHIPTPFADGSVSSHTIQKILSTLADIVVENSPLPPDIIADIVRQPVQIVQPTKPKSGAKPASVLGVANLLKFNPQSLRAIVEGNVWPLPTLSPNLELICLAQKPFKGTIANNVLKHGVGGLNIDACRVPAIDSQLAEKYASVRNAPPRDNAIFGKDTRPRSEGNLEPHALGRWPANVITDGSEEVLEAFAQFGEKISPMPYIRQGGSASKSEEIYGSYTSRDGGINASYGDTGTAARFFTTCEPDPEPPRGKRPGPGIPGSPKGDPIPNGPTYDDTAGSPSRFYYTAKANEQDRWCGNRQSAHPTIKPLALMRWLVQLITPPGGHVLDPFAGSGTTLQAAYELGMNSTGIEAEPEYQQDIKRRVTQVQWLKLAAKL